MFKTIKKLFSKSTPSKVQLAEKQSVSEVKVNPASVIADVTSIENTLNATFVSESTLNKIEKKLEKGLVNAIESNPEVASGMLAYFTTGSFYSTVKVAGTVAAVNETSKFINDNKDSNSIVYLIDKLGNALYKRAKSVVNQVHNVKFNHDADNSFKQLAVSYLAFAAGSYATGGSSAAGYLLGGIANALAEYKLKNKMKKEFGFEDFNDYVFNTQIINSKGMGVDKALHVSYFVRNKVEGLESAIKALSKNPQVNKEQLKDLNESLSMWKNAIRQINNSTASTLNGENGFNMQPLWNLLDQEAAKLKSVLGLVKSNKVVLTVAQNLAIQKEADKLCEVAGILNNAFNPDYKMQIVTKEVYISDKPVAEFEGMLAQFKNITTDGGRSLSKQEMMIKQEVEDSEWVSVERKFGFMKAGA